MLDHKVYGHLHRATLLTPGETYQALLMAPLFLHQQNVSSLLADKEKRAGAADMNISVFNLAIKFSVSSARWGLWMLLG